MICDACHGKGYVDNPQYDRYSNVVAYENGIPSNSTKHNPSKKLSLEEQYQLARLGAMRTWPLKNKIISNGK